MGVWVVAFDFWYLNIFTWFLGGPKVWVEKSLFRIKNLKMDIRYIFWCHMDIVVKQCVKVPFGWICILVPFACVPKKFPSCECWVKKVRIFDNKVTKIRVSKIRVSRIRVSEIRVSKIRVSKIRVSEIRVSEIRVSKIRVREIRVSKIRVREIRVSEIRISSNHHELYGAIFYPFRTSWQQFDFNTL